MMRVRELIEALQKVPQDARVLVRGYEGGYDDIDGGDVGLFALNVNKEWYYGNHDAIIDGRDRERYPESIFTYETGVYLR